MANQVARLLAHPLRQFVLFEYEQPNSPSKVARRLGEPVNLVSYHTDVLRRHGWIELVGTERRRGAVEHFYRATGEPTIEDDQWRRISRRLRHGITLGTLGAVGETARRAALEGGFDGPRAHLSRSVLELDEEGVAEVAALLRGVIDRLEEIQTCARARRSAELVRHQLVIQYFLDAGSSGEARR